MITLGIDPGKYGAMAIFNGALQRVEDMPISGTDVDPALLCILMRDMLADARPTVYVEHQHAMPKQGVSTTFALGRRYGMILGIVAALELPIELVMPGRWKAATKTPRDKDAARARASQIMPEGAKFWLLKKHHGRAEAALIAWYGSHSS